LADSLTRKIAPGVVVIADVADGKASLLVMVSTDATAKVKAGNIIKQIPGARGGGKPDLAEGGVEAVQLENALNAIPQIVRQMLGG
jgi:alanyl-tRNA synthetase